MNIVLSCLLIFPGFVFLSAAMDRHSDVLLKREPSVLQRRLIQLLGAVLLALGLWACIEGAGTSVGIALWFGVLTVCAMALALLFSYWPKRIHWLSIGALAGAAALGVLA